MANYFVIDNTFRPYSFDELVKPYQMYGEAYKEQEAAVGKLESDAATLASAISRTNDPTAYQTYNLYLDRVKQAADDLALNGLTSNSRRIITSLGRDYNNSIVPIQAAYNRRKELQDEQRKAMLSNDSMMFQRDLNAVGPESSIDRFLEDPNYSYGKAVSGNAITARTSEMASHLAKELTGYGQGKPLDKYTNTSLQTHGFTRDQVLNVIQNPQDPNAQPVLYAIVDSAVGASGIPTWNDEAALEKVYDYAGMGLWSAVGQSSVSTFENHGNRLAAQEAMQKRVKAYNPNPDPKINGVPINPLNIYGQKDRTQANKNIREYSDYFEQVNGKWVLSKKGLAEYNKSYDDPYLVNTVTTSDGKKQVSSKSQFRVFLDEIMQSYGETVGDAWENYINSHREDMYDATRSTEYDYTYDPTQQDSMKQVVLTAAQGAGLQAVDYDANSKSFVATGESLDLAEFTKPEYKVVASRMSSGGTQIMVQNSKTGVTTRYRMPAGINLSAEASRDNAFRQADQYRELFASAETPQEQALAYQKYSEALQSAYLFQSQIGLTNKTKPEEFNPYTW